MDFLSATFDAMMPISSDVCAIVESMESDGYGYFDFEKYSLPFLYSGSFERLFMAEITSEIGFDFQFMNSSEVFPIRSLFDNHSNTRT